MVLIDGVISKVVTSASSEQKKLNVPLFYLLLQSWKFLHIKTVQKTLYMLNGIKS